MSQLWWRGWSVVLMGLHAWACAGEQAWSAGTYVTQGGWGHLEVQAATSSGQPFAISSQGANGHSCTLEGVIHGGEARLTAFEPACVVRFVAQAGGGIEVQSTTLEPCRDYCGARAGFTGVYLPLPAVCAPKAWGQSDRAFMMAYRARDYGKAVQLQQDRLKNCELSLFWLDAFQVRNDLAIAQFHNGQLTACRQSLVPIRAVRVVDLPPADAEGFAPIAKAAAFNWRKCGGR